MIEDQTPPVGTEQESVTPQPNPEPVVVPQEPVPAAPVEPAPKAEDYEVKFKASAREAQILAAKNAKLEDMNRKLTNQDPPSDSELRSRFPGWDTYDSFTKGVLTTQLSQEKKLANTDTLLADLIADQKFHTELSQLFTKPDYAALKNDPEFEDFVLKPKHKGLDIETIADAYLLRNSKLQAPVTDPGLERGSGGNRTAAPTKFSTEEVAHLRTSDPKRYKQLLISGQIDI